MSMTALLDLRHSDPVDVHPTLVLFCPPKRARLFVAFPGREETAGLLRLQIAIRRGDTDFPTRDIGKSPKLWSSILRKMAET